MKSSIPSLSALMLGGLRVATAQTAYFCGDSTMAAAGANDGDTDGIYSAQGSGYFRG